MRTIYEKECIQSKYREEIQKKANEERHTKKALVVAIIVITIILLDHKYNPQPPIGEETPITIQKVE